jgi:molybdopterin synthase catalytic subunit
MAAIQVEIPAIRLCSITEEPLDLVAARAAVADPAAGGEAVFLGVVRNEADGRDVLALEYSAHPTAQARLAEVAAEVVRNHDLIGLAVVHRVGELQIGDVAVICAVSSAHRQEAFTACRELIDQLKARVPIWKHEHFADGAQQWVGTP